ncbi:IS66 family insertion sequence element accessory protein TnpA [Labilibaculum euxinus]
MNRKEEMLTLVEQWRKSGLTRKSSANQHGLKSESFNYWCKKQYGEVEKVKADQRTYIR